MMDVIDPEDLPALLFGQQHLLTEFFFQDRTPPYHSVALSRFPHSEFLRGSAVNENPDPYTQYLRSSWEYYYERRKNTPDRRQRRQDEFVQLYEGVRRRYLSGATPFDRPVKVCERPDGKTVLVDGNHRAAIALALALPLPTEVVPLRRQLESVANVPGEFYGTERLSMPYQSIVRSGVELVKGRRPDIVERMRTVQRSDLEGRTVLDLGCNLGMNCYQAVERGAAVAVGVDRSTAIVSAAIRLNSYFARPCFFMAHNLDEELTVLPFFDTVFCFSLVSHLSCKPAIVETLRRVVGRVLYFEGHAGTRRSDYDFVLNSDSFSSVELVGFGLDGIHANTRTRPLFRCEPVTSRAATTEPAHIPALFRQGGGVQSASVRAFQAERAASSPNQ